MNRSRAMNRTAGRRHGRRASVWRRLPGGGRFLLGLLTLLAGCKTDLNQQLLERELRMQEDQIYRLQDELESKAARLERVAGENASLKRQLGLPDSAPVGRSPLPTPSDPSRPSAPGASPAPRTPAGTAPDGLRFAPPPGAANPLPAPPSLAPPALDGVPPLPGASGMAPGVRRLSFEESLAGEARISHLVINPAKSVCFDGDGDGVPEGLALVIEPRDADERLVTAAGDLVVFVNDPAVAPGAAPAPPEPTDPGEGGCVARWDIPEAEAIARFRRTSRARGIHLVLRWPGPPPRSPTVQVHALLTTFDGTVHRVEAPVSVATGGEPTP